MERELTSKRIQFLKKDYSRGFVADVGYEANRTIVPFFLFLENQGLKKPELIFKI